MNFTDTNTDTNITPHFNWWFKFGTKWKLRQHMSCIWKHSITSFIRTYIRVVWITTSISHPLQTLRITNNIKHSNAENPTLQQRLNISNTCLNTKVFYKHKPRYDNRLFQVSQICADYKFRYYKHTKTSEMTETYKRRMTLRLKPNWQFKAVYFSTDIRRSLRKAGVPYNQ